MVAPPVAPPSACIERDAYSAATDVLGGALLGSVVCTAPAIDVAGDVADDVAGDVAGAALGDNDAGDAEGTDELAGTVCGCTDTDAVVIRALVLTSTGAVSVLSADIATGATLGIAPVAAASSPELNHTNAANPRDAAETPAKPHTQDGVAGAITTW